MKTFISISFRQVFLAFAVIVLASSFAFGTAPIPGLNIIVKKNPGGIIAFNGTSDKAGKFSSKRLAAGTYTIHFSMPIVGRKAIENLPPFTLQLATGNKVMVDGKERNSVGNITVNDDTTIQIIIGTKGGTIAGTINSFGINQPGVK